MIVDIQNVKTKTWTNYVLGKNRDRVGAKLILGDTDLSDQLTNKLNYKTDTVRFVISFTEQDNVTKEQARKIVKEFFDEFMYGYDENEYLLDIAEHNDTSYLHYHARVPKFNLLTQTQLKLYYHKSDLDFKKAIIDKLADKYNLEIGDNSKKLIKDATKKIQYINKWRKEHNQKEFDFSKKKGRAEAENEITRYFQKAILSDLINSVDDIKAELKEMGLEVVKQSYDKGKEFYYLTIQNDTGKIRLKGDIYGEKFYGYSKQDKTKRILFNRSINKRERSDRQSRSDIERTLQKERTKRLRFIQERYASSRKRAIQRINQEQRENDPKQQSNRGTHEVVRQNNDNHDSINDQHNNRLNNRNIFNEDDDRSIKNDRIRAEIIRRIRSLRSREARASETTRESIQKRIERDNIIIQRADEYSVRSDRKASSNTQEVRKNINELANKYKRRSVNIITESINIVARSINIVAKSIKSTKQVIEVLKEKLILKSELTPKSEPKSKPASIPKPKPKSRGPGM